MKILLPPSEGKNDAPAGGAPLELDALVFPELSERREELIGKLDALSHGQPARALKALGLSAGQAGELERNTDLLAKPAAAAIEIYSGVLYKYLGISSLSAAARRRAAERMLIQSALFGVLRPEDRIPAYRLSIGAALPGIKGLASWWRPALSAALPEDGLVVDMRSGAYAAAWKPPQGVLLGVRVFVEEDGERSVVTHMAKATRGDVARILVEAEEAAADPHEVLEIVTRADLRAELVEPQKSGAPWQLDVIQSERVGRLSKTR